MSKKRISDTADTINTLEQVIKLKVPTIVVFEKLTDVKLHNDKFAELPPGRYVIQFTTPHAVQPVSVYWTGEQLEA